MTAVICKPRKDKKTYGKSQGEFTRSKPYLTNQIVYYDEMTYLVD